MTVLKISMARELLIALFPLLLFHFFLAGHRNRCHNHQGLFLGNISEVDQKHLFNCMHYCSFGTQSQQPITPLQNCSL